MSLLLSLSIASTVMPRCCQVPTFESIIRLVDLRSQGGTHCHDQMDEVTDPVGIVPVTENATRLYETCVGCAARASS